MQGVQNFQKHGIYIFKQYVSYFQVISLTHLSSDTFPGKVFKAMDAVTNLQKGTVQSTYKF